MFVLKTCRPEVSFKIPKCLNKCQRSKERERVLKDLIYELADRVRVIRKNKVLVKVRIFVRFSVISAHKSQL